MFENLESVQIGENTLPIKCDINVLIEVQDQFGSTNEFEMQLVGLRYQKNKDGTNAIDSDGKVLFTRTEPSLRAIQKILPCMIIEGLEAEGKAADIDRIKREINDMQFDMIQVTKKMHDEFTKCFKRKNA